jgi:hypothetical protein
MLFAFDLWKEADLLKHGEQILLRLLARHDAMRWRMGEKIALFERWVAGGTADTASYG